MSHNKDLDAEKVFEAIMHPDIDDFIDDYRETEQLKPCGQCGFYTEENEVTGLCDECEENIMLSYDSSEYEEEYDY